MEKPKQEICSIAIIFPAESDEQAITIKQNISKLVSEIEGVRIHFNISASPIKPPTG